MKTRRAVGKVVAAEWNEGRKRLEFVVEFSGSGLQLSGSIPSGYDPVQKTYVSADALKMKRRELLGKKVYDESGLLEKSKLSREQLSRLQFRVSLSGGGISVLDPGLPPDTNTFLSRILR